MVAIPLLSGVRGSKQGEFGTVAPLNLEPVAVGTNLSNGQLRAAAGAVQFATGPGVDRGGFEWRGACYRVMGTKLVRVTAAGEVTAIGEVGGAGAVRMDYSFDRLGIRSGTALWLYDGTTLAQVTDQDLGQVKDMLWVGGYWMTTDGSAIVVTELTNPFAVEPLKYGSAERDPDPITGLIKIGGEVHALGRHTIEPLRNQGGAGFPFVPLIGAAIPYGCVSATAKCLFGNTYAFVGSGRNQSLGVFLAGQADATRISTREVEDALDEEASPEDIVLETRTYRDEQRLVMHLADESWVFLANATTQAKAPLWYRAASGSRSYRIRHAVQIGGQYMVGDADSVALGWLSEDVSSHFGAETEWGFQTGYAYNGGNGGILRSVELVGLPGRVPAEERATVFMSLTRDGQTWSSERAIDMGRAGQRSKRLEWRPKTRFANYIGMRFRGYNRAMPGFARIEADIAPLGA